MPTCSHAEQRLRLRLFCLVPDFQSDRSRAAEHRARPRRLDPSERDPTVAAEVLAQTGGESVFDVHDFLI